MTLRVDMQRQDIVDAVRLQSRKQVVFSLVLWLLIAGMDAFSVFGAKLSGGSFRDGLRISAPSLVVLVLLALVFGGLLWLKPIWVARKMILRPVDWSIDEQGVRMRSDVAASDISWAAYVKYVEGKKTVLLYIQKKQAQVLPKRALTEVQLVELRSILNAHVARG